MKNNIEFIPYVEVDGIRTFKDSFIASLYNRIVKEGNGHIFNDGQIQTDLAFLHAMKYNSQLYLVYFDNDLIGMCWLNRIERHNARVHWCGFNTGSPRKLVLAGRKFLKDISKYYDVIIGYTPKSNLEAVRYSMMCGMKYAAEVPKLCWNYKTGKSETGIISYYVRENQDENL